NLTTSQWLLHSKRAEAGEGEGHREVWFKGNVPLAAKVRQDEWPAEQSTHVHSPAVTRRINRKHQHLLTNGPWHIRTKRGPVSVRVRGASRIGQRRSEDVVAQGNPEVELDPGMQRELLVTLEKVAIGDGGTDQLIDSSPHVIRSGEDEVVVGKPQVEPPGVVEPDIGRKTRQAAGAQVIAKKDCPVQRRGVGA